MENRYGLWRQGSGLWRSLRDGDFDEEDVWGVLKDNRDISPKPGQSMESPLPVPKLNISTSAARMIPINSTGSPTGPREGKGAALKQQQSAPVAIPDWSRIYGKKASSKNTYSWIDCHGDDDHDVDDDGGYVHDGRYCDVYDDEDDDGDDNGYDLKLPPHEFLARRLARSQISSFSVFEGEGRTLKGRDLSKVRNAVLTRTGFLE